MPIAECSNHLREVRLALVENDDFGRRRDESENVANGIDQNLITSICRNCYRYENRRCHLIVRASGNLGKGTRFFHKKSQNGFWISPFSHASPGVTGTDLFVKPKQ